MFPRPSLLREVHVYRLWQTMHRLFQQGCLVRGRDQSRCIYVPCSLKSRCVADRLTTVTVDVIAGLRQTPKENSLHSAVPAAFVLCTVTPIALSCDLVKGSHVPIMRGPTHAPYCQS